MRYCHRYSPHKRAQATRIGGVFRNVQGMTLCLVPLVFFINTTGCATFGTMKDKTMGQTHDEPTGSSGSLKLEEPATLAGPWVIATAQGDCRVVFTTTRIDSANAWVVEDSTNCLAGIVPDTVGWRPTPDGIALAAADRRTVALFARGADGWSATLPGGAATLRRG